MKTYEKMNASLKEATNKVIDFLKKNKEINIIKVLMEDVPAIEEGVFGDEDAKPFASEEEAWKDETFCAIYGEQVPWPFTFESNSFTCFYEDGYFCKARLDDNGKIELCLRCGSTFKWVKLEKVQRPQLWFVIQTLAYWMEIV